MSILDNLNEKTVDVRELSERADVVIDNYQWHLELALPFEDKYENHEDILKNKGYYVTGMLDKLHCVAKCDVVGLDLASDEYIKPMVLPSGVILRSTYGDSPADLPCIIIGMEIVRGTSLRCLMRMMYIITNILNEIYPGNTYRHSARFEYNGDDARYIERVDNNVLEYWRNRSFLGDSTEHVLRCLGFDVNSQTRKNRYYIERCSFETEKFKELSIIRSRRPGEITLPMVITREYPAVLEIHSSDFALVYFRYYILACVLSDLSDRLKIYGTKLEKDPRYPQRMRLIADWMKYREAMRPEQLINYQKVYDTASLILSQFPLENPTTYTPEYLYKICKYINENINSIR